MRRFSHVGRTGGLGDSGEAEADRDRNALGQDVSGMVELLRNLEQVKGTHEK